VGGYPPWFDDLTDRTKERPPPPDDASDLEWILYYQEKVLTRRQAMATMSIARLRHLVESGRWQRVKPGVFVAHNGPLTRGQHLWSAVLGCGEGAVLAGLTAACAAGLRRDQGSKIHVLLPVETRRNQPGPAVWAGTDQMPIVAVHRTSVLPEKDVHRRALPPRTTTARSLVDAAQWAGTDDEARAVVAAGCRQRLTTPEEIVDVLHRMRRARRRAVVLETMGYVSSGAEALSEINFDKLCRTFRLPLPDRQVPRVDRSGRLRYLDAYWRSFRVHAEVDGGYHLDPEAYWADMFRQNGLWIGGEKVLRFPAWAIVRRPAQVADQLRDAFMESGWRPGDLG
jgi:hypothetical protein